MFYPHRVVDIPDGKPKWTGLDKSSNLLDDDGNPRDPETDEVQDEGSSKRKREEKS